MDTIETLLKDGNKALHAGDLNEAARLYRSALDMDTENASAHNNLGFVLGRQQRWPEALAHLRTALRLNPSLSMAHANLGQVLVATGQAQEGLAHLEQAVACDPVNVTAWDSLARIRILLGDFQGGEYAAIRALKLLPGAPHLLTRLGTALAAQNRLLEALQCYQQAIAIDQDYGEAWSQLGITRFLRNDLGSARDALQRAVALNPNDTNSIRHLALVSLSLGNRDDAIALFERLLSLQPDDAESRLDLAVLFLSKLQADAALRHLDLIGGSTRDSDKYRFYRGVALQRNGQQEQGACLLRELAEQHPDAYGEKARKIIQNL